MRKDTILLYEKLYGHSHTKLVELYHSTKKAPSYYPDNSIDDTTTPDEWIIAPPK